MRTQFSKIVFMAGIMLALIFTLSCSSGEDDGGGGSGKGNNIANYKTVQIGTQTWMAENLNYNASGSVCYDNDPANCVKYGRLYKWETAKTVCPSGWHLPSNAEWSALISYVENDKGCSSCAGLYLKTTDWGGTDDFGFSALPGGRGYPNGGFLNVGDYGNWWTATENDATYAYYRNIYYFYANVSSSDFNKTYLFSVRCVQD